MTAAVVRDDRIPYGAQCTWWDSIDKAGSLVFPGGELTRGNGTKSTLEASTLPCCPHCKGVLMQVDNIAAWNASVEKHAAAKPDAGYPAFIRWLRGRCFPTIAIARNAYEAEKAAGGDA